MAAQNEYHSDLNSFDFQQALGETFYREEEK